MQPKKQLLSLCQPYCCQFSFLAQRRLSFAVIHHNVPSPIRYDNNAIKDAVSAFELAKQMSIGMKGLHIGLPWGSPPGPVRLKAVAQAVNVILSKLFPAHIEVIAQPGLLLLHNRPTHSLSPSGRRGGTVGGVNASGE